MIHNQFVGAIIFEFDKGFVIHWGCSMVDAMCISLPFPRQNMSLLNDGLKPLLSRGYNWTGGL